MNSVDAKDGAVVAAVEADDKAQPGTAVFFDRGTPERRRSTAKSADLG